MSFKVGDRISYDLCKSNLLDRRKGQSLLDKGLSVVAEGTITDIYDDILIISGPTYLGRKKVPLEAVLTEE